MPPIKTAHILSHTHWDREWYLNSPYTNPWLVPFFDSLFKMLEKEPGYRFVLDGQTSMIEDWLEQLQQRGEDATSLLTRLSQFASQGRVCVGPYYLQPDWQLVSEESLVRNLLIGQRMARALGGSMPVGWLLDNFGQISQTAQVHRQFGLDGLFVWRGVEMDPREIKSEFLWQSPDGSQVTAVYLVGSYRNGMRLAEYADSMPGRIRGEIKKLGPFATSPNILLMNGYDQEMLPDDILPMLRQLGELEGARVIQSTPQEYLQAVTSAALREPLPVLRGALYSGRYISVFPGILSSRMYLKLQNDACQKLLEKAAEPLCATLWALGGDYPAAEFDRAWRLLLKNHPHDSICAVSIDDVHTDMEARFEKSAQVARQLAGAALADLSAAIDTTFQGEAQKSWVVFNTALRPAGELVEIASSMPEGTRFVDSLGVRLPSQKTIAGVVLLLPQVPALGYQALFAVPDSIQQGQLVQPDGPSLQVDLAQNAIENDFIRLVVNADGSLELTDKVNRVSYPNLLVFEDGGDAGDTYNTSNPRHDLILTTRNQKAKVRFIETGPLRARLQIDHTLLVPEALSADRSSRSTQRIALSIRTIITVEAHSPVIKCRTSVNNTARDHRLRVLFPTGLMAESAYTETQFDVVERQISPPRYDDSTIPENVKQVIIGAREPEPVTIYPQRTFVDLSNGQWGLAVLNQGLPEVEVLPEQNTIALTLFRGVDWIARPDLLTRIGDAGPLIFVPGAQCLRKMAFQYAIYPHCGDWQSGGVVQQADQFNSRLLVVETDCHPGALAPAGSLIRLDDPSQQFKVTAVKRSEDGQTLLVRFHNPTAQKLTTSLWSALPVSQAWLADLAENPLESIPVHEGHTLQVAAAPHKILTILLRLIRGDGKFSTFESISIPEEVASAGWDEFAGSLPPPSIRAEDISREERRAAELAAVLAEKEQALQQFTAQGEVTSQAGLLRMYQLQLDAASFRRTALEAQLSETLLKKNAWLEANPGFVDTETLAAYQANLRRIGDAINTARVEKRALEYVVDLYSKLATTPESSG